MANKKQLNKVTVRTAKPLSKKQEGFLSQIKWGESYTSLFLGAVVVVVALILVFSFLKSRNLNNQQTGSTSTTTKEETYKSGVPKSYSVKKGDDLWSVSEKIYGSGYNWVDLAKTNNLENPGLLYVGTKLSVPDVKAKILTVSKTEVKVLNPITTDKYTVVKGDYLWDIAVRAYGDGYKWVEIAKVNNLVNPDVIYSGNVLKLPR